MGFNVEPKIQWGLVPKPSQSILGHFHHPPKKLGPFPQHFVESWRALHEIIHRNRPSMGPGRAFVSDECPFHSPWFRVWYRFVGSDLSAFPTQKHGGYSASSAQFFCRGRSPSMKLCLDPGSGGVQQSGRYFPVNFPHKRSSLHGSGQKLPTRQPPSPHLPGQGK